MDRQIIYPGSIPLETDLLNTNRSVLIALGKLAAATLGTATTVNGLACTQTAVPSMAVSVGAGEIYMLANLDGSAYSSLAADTTHQIVKQGVMLDAATLACAAPATAGQSVVYLIQATYQDVDATSVVLPYYNSSNPALAYSGPGGSGAAQYTQRKGTVVLSAKAGTPATTGTQVAPAADAGYVGLYTVTVANGATTVVNANIALVTGAPFVSAYLTAVTAAATYAPLSAFTGANRSLTANGYQKLPGGLIFQWGSASVGDVVTGTPGSTGSVTFPTAFPTACLQALLTLQAGNSQSQNSVAVTAISTSSVSYQMQEWASAAQNMTLVFFAIGY